MKRKRIAAILMALSLMVSGLPMTSVYAAEIPEAEEAVTQEVEEEETPTEDSAVEDTDEKEADSAQNNASVEQEREAQDENDVTDEPQQGDPEETEPTDETELTDETEPTNETEESRLNDEKTAVKKLTVAENAKMAGSNGILYDGVTYLSARNVLAMDEEMQEIYRDLCDEVAETKESGLEMQDIVFAVDANGDLYYFFYIPMTSLAEIQEDMLPDTDGSLTSETEESEAEEKKEGETSGDDKDAQEENREEDTFDEDRDAAEEEKKDDETSEDEKDAVEEEKKDDETSEDDKDEVEGQDEEATEDDADASEEEEEKDDEAVEDEQAAEEENDALSEENLDLIPEMEEEIFEEIESVRIENTIDLGYDSSTSDEFGADRIQFASILPTEKYFEDQLTSIQKKYYGYLKAKLLKGSNKVSFNDSRFMSNSIVGNIAHATSALILSYPDKTDWMANPGGFSGKGVYRLGSSVATYTFTYDKSKFYSGSLDSKARSQVKTVGNLAQQYAADNYPNAPVYGIVRYLDQWICENGYYDDVGTENLPAYAEGVKALKKQGYSKKQIDDLYRSYYECHSAYGILLKGHGVCESYAKAMSRLLDAVGIPNLYVVGSAGSQGHAWNYVQMPNGSWYLLDSTWNDTTNPAHTTSSRSYLLVANDGKHAADGRYFKSETGKFTFASLAGSSYSAGSVESIKLSKAVCNLKPKDKEKLTCTVSGKNNFGKVSKVWSSSNSKVAKVDQKGNVTAVAVGTATITVSMAGISATCKVYVDQIKAVKSAATNKASESISLGNTVKAKGSKSITLKVDRGNSPHDAEWMLKNDEKTTAPVVTCSKKAGKDVVTATVPKVSGDTITFNIAAVADNGSSKVTVKFGGKTVTINVTVGTIITQDMFDITWPAGETAAGNMTYVYTGKAIKPTVKKKADAVYKPVTFKASYVNNVNAGTAKVVVAGTGKYGGVLEYSFTIKPIDIKDADFSKALKSKAYNGGNNPPATTVKLGKKTLKANKDYQILYNNKTLSTVPAGTYTISIRGIGNYAGTVITTQPYEVTKNTIAKVSVAGSNSVKYTGVRQNPYTVKIGKNVLPGTDYTITWYQGQGKKQSATAMKQLPLAKGKYTAVIKIKGNNLTNTAKKTEIKKNFTIR